MSKEATTEELFTDLQAVVRDAEELLRATSGLAGDKVQEIRARTEETIKQARSRIGDVEVEAVRRVKEAANATEGYVRDNPLQAVGIAAGVGLLVGLLLSRRS
jgi:ElaB/YqjD/DUF883 family membrane-anchored ribosome-binding protein